jgi:hypothetical protein
MAHSFGCRRCYGEDPQSVWAYYEEGLVVEQELVGDSHFLVQLRRCAECGQQFVWIFGEAVDCEGAEDAQHRSVVPLSVDEARSLSERGAPLDLPSVVALGRERRYLRTDWPTGAASQDIGWDTGDLPIRAID